MNNKEIEFQTVNWDWEENDFSLVTKFTDNSIQCEPITKEEAFQWYAENRF